ncbi:MAG: 50S ribosomal protein L5 [Planctomycetota bacterium]
MAKDKGGKGDGATAEAEQYAAPRLREKFEKEVRPKLGKEFGLTNPMRHPRLEKIVINVNMGRFLEGTKVPANVKDTILSTLTKISGQKPIVIQAKKSVANFKVREGFDSAAMVTMRSDRMWHFLDRFINLAAPRIRDFRGLKDNSFDRGGSYSMGLTEQGVFPEIDMGQVNFQHGMHINYVFSNSTPEVSKFVLKELGMPFKKDDEN